MASTALYSVSGLSLHPCACVCMNIYICASASVCLSICLPLIQPQPRLTCGTRSYWKEGSEVEAGVVKLFHTQMCNNIHKPTAYRAAEWFKTACFWKPRQEASMLETAVCLFQTPVAFPGEELTEKKGIPAF